MVDVVTCSNEIDETVTVETPTPTVTAVPSNTPTAIPTVVATARPAATPIGKFFAQTSAPAIKLESGDLIVHVKDSVKGLRDYYVVVVNTATQKLYARTRVRMSNGAEKAVYKNIPASTYRICTIVLSSNSVIRHSGMRWVTVKSIG